MFACERYGFAWVFAAMAACGGVTLSPMPDDDAGAGVSVTRDPGTDRNAPIPTDGGRSNPDTGVPTSDPVPLDATVIDAGNFGGFVDCPLPVDYAACGTDDDCAYAGLGCYCGAQPVLGISKSLKLLADLCEQGKANSCDMACAQGVDFVTQASGQVASDADAIGVTCVPRLESGVCVTYVK